MGLLYRIRCLIARDARAIETILRLEIVMSAQLDALKAQVAQNTAVTQSAVTLIAGIADRIKAAASQDDVGAALDALTTELKGDSDALAAAVAANTPAASAPTSDAPADTSGSASASTDLPATASGSDAPTA